MEAVQNTTYHRSLEVLKQRGIEFVDTYVPFFLCSAGAHVFNLANQEVGFYVEAGQIPNSRVHIIYVAPPGFSKSFFLRQLLEGANSILGGSVIKTSFESYMTEAGFVGTFKIGGKEGTPLELPGMAFDAAQGIAGCEEFSAITNAFTQMHSTNLDVALLTALDSGWVRKRLGAGKIEYQTNVTLWAGSQPARFDLTSGFARRFIFLQSVPTEADQRKITIARRQLRDKKTPKQQLDELKEKVNQMYKDVWKIQRVHFSENMMVWFDQRRIPHYEEPLYERLAIGYFVMTGQFGADLFVRMTPEIEKIFEREFKWRSQLKRGSETSQVVVLLREAGGSMKTIEMKKKLLDLGVDWSRSTDLINELLRNKTLTTKDEILYVKDAV